MEVGPFRFRLEVLQAVIFDVLFDVPAAQVVGSIWEDKIDGIDKGLLIVGEKHGRALVVNGRMKLFYSPGIVLFLSEGIEQKKIIEKL